MTTDSADTSPPPGKPAASVGSQQQEDALFQALLHRVAKSSDKIHLQDRCDAALRLILNRDNDQFLRDELTAQIARLAAALPDDVSDDQGKIALAKVVEASLAILRMAEKKRIAPPPPEAKPMAAASSAASYERQAQHEATHPHPHPHSSKHRRNPNPSESDEQPSLRNSVGLILALLVILGCGLAIGLRGRNGAEQQIRPLVAQIEAAIHGDAPGTNIFGGRLKVSVEGGRKVVTVEGIPPGECVSSGWDLVRKGILTVNGVTPNRVSAAILNDLCHEEDKATLIWAAKENR